MRINYLLLSLLFTLLVSSPAVAQTADVVRQAEAGRKGDSVQVFLTLNPERLSLPATGVLTVTPWLVSASDSLPLPSIHVVGRTVYYRYLRHDSMGFILPDDHIIWERHRHRPFAYLEGAVFRPWMDKAVLRLVIQRTADCDRLIEELQRSHQITDANVVARPPSYEMVPHTVTGRMSIIFPLDRTEYHPELYHNAEEIQKIYDGIDTVLADTTAVLQSVHMKGWASPEGPYWNNVRLARGRVDTLAKHVAEHYRFPKDILTTENEPEDWPGLIDSIRLADPRNLPHKAELLQIALRTDLEPDRKEHLMRTTYPDDFDYLLEHCLPLLRHSDYTIRYLRHEWVEHPGEKDTLWTLPALAGRDYAPIPLTYRPYTALLALKTNLLWDAILAPNFEIEVPLGTANRWSIMGEYWTPWYVWHHNSRAYELQLWGLELRRWNGQCRQRVPLLTGSFWGYYAAFGRYDFEWKHVGDQGELFSVGATYGYSWPISRHWNLELSASIGVFAGPQRHYHGEFDDTHLIWKKNRTLFYAGPTKLKCSLVWIIGTTRKGGDHE